VTEAVPAASYESAAAPAQRESVAPVVGFPQGLDANHQSTAEERYWLYGHLGARYDLHASSVVRLIAVHPGLRAAAGGSEESTVADLIAVKSYLVEGRADLDQAAAEGRFDEVRPFVHCVISGLRQLPSYRGAALTGCRLDVGEEPITPGAVVGFTDFRHAAVMHDYPLGGSTECVIWSAVGRRVELLEPDLPLRRVLFQPGSRFRVLDPGDPADPVRRVMLRQIIGDAAYRPLDEGDLAIRKRLAKAVGERDAAAGLPELPVDDGPWSLIAS
jgi:hypothetical protein